MLWAIAFSMASTQAARVGLFVGTGSADEWDGGTVLDDGVGDAFELTGVVAEQLRCRRHDHVSPAEDLLLCERPVGSEHLVDQLAFVHWRELTRRDPVSARRPDASGDLVRPPSDVDEFLSPSRDQVVDRFEPLGRPARACRDSSGPVRVEAGLVEGVVDLVRALGVEVHHLLGHAGDRPVAELPGRAVVGHDPVAEVDRLPRRRHPAHSSGGMNVITDEGGVGSLPPATAVEHGGDVGDEDVVVRARVAGSGRGVPGVGVEQSPGGRRHRCAAPSAAALRDHLVEVVERGLAFGVEDGVHVVGPADHAQLGHRLVGTDDQLHARPLRDGESEPGVGVGGTAGSVDGLVVLRLDRARQAEERRSSATPAERGLTTTAVVLESSAGVVVASAEHGGLVVGDGVCAHHAEERHRSLPRSVSEAEAVQPAGCKRVLRFWGCPSGYRSRTRAEGRRCPRS